jgi:hypothetical protein
MSRARKAASRFASRRCGKGTPAGWGSRHRRRATLGCQRCFQGCVPAGLAIKYCLKYLYAERDAQRIVNFRNAAYYGTLGCGRWNTTGCELKGSLSGLRPQHSRKRPHREVACLSACGREAPAPGGPACARDRLSADIPAALSEGCSIRSARCLASLWTRRAQPGPLPCNG